MPEDCTLLIPASGLSRRFGEADKLLADLGGQPLAQYVIDTSAKVGFTRRVAVVPKGDAARRELFISSGFDVLDNPAPEAGQGASIALAMKDIQTPAVCIMLADMPFVPAKHIEYLLQCLGKNMSIYSAIDGVSQPPAVFSGQAVEALRFVSGDRGMRGETQSHDRKTVPLEACFGQDIDTPQDLLRAEQSGLTRTMRRDSGDV